MAEGRDRTEVQVTNSLFMLIEKEVDCTPDQALFAVGVVTHVVGLVAVDRAVGQLHLLVDRIPHPRKRAINTNTEVEKRRIEAIDDGAMVAFATEVTRSKDTREVVVRMRSV